MKLTAIAKLLNVKESEREADYLPKDLHNSIIAVTDVVASTVRRIGNFRHGEMLCTKLNQSFKFLISLGG